MTKDTKRDRVWNQALQYAVDEENFNLDRVINAISDAPSRRTARDTLSTMVDYGWLAKPSPRAHEWVPGPRAKGEPYDESPSSPDASNNHHTPIEEAGVISPSDLEVGKKYTGKVDRFSGKNAIVELERGHINLGPIDKDAIDQRVSFENKSGAWGKCLDEEYTYESYEPKDGQSESRSKSGLVDDKKYHTGRSPSTDSSSDTDNKNKLLKDKL